MDEPKEETVWPYVHIEVSSESPRADLCTIVTKLVENGNVIIDDDHILEINSQDLGANVVVLNLEIKPPLKETGEIIAFITTFQLITGLTILRIDFEGESPTAARIPYNRDKPTE